MKHSGYFEGILQLRNTGKEVDDFILNLVNKTNEIIISKGVKVRNGIDLYFTSQKFLQVVGKKLKKSRWVMLLCLEVRGLIRSYIGL